MPNGAEMSTWPGGVFTGSGGNGQGEVNGRSWLLDRSTGQQHWTEALDRWVVGVFRVVWRCGLLLCRSHRKC